MFYFFYNYLYLGQIMVKITLNICTLSGYQEMLFESSTIICVVCGKNATESRKTCWVSKMNAKVYLHT